MDVAAVNRFSRWNWPSVISRVTRRVPSGCAEPQRIVLVYFLRFCPVLREGHHIRRTPGDLHFSYLHFLPLPCILCISIYSIYK